MCISIADASQMNLWVGSDSRASLEMVDVAPELGIVTRVAVQWLNALS